MCLLLNHYHETVLWEYLNQVSFQLAWHYIGKSKLLEKIWFWHGHHIHEQVIGAVSWSNTITACWTLKTLASLFFLLCSLENNPKPSEIQLSTCFLPSPKLLSIPEVIILPFWLVSPGFPPTSLIPNLLCWFLFFCLASLNLSSRPQSWALFSISLP